MNPWGRQIKNRHRKMPVFFRQRACHCRSSGAMTVKSLTPKRKGPKIVQTIVTIIKN